MKVRQMAFRSNVSKEMRDITEGGFLGADATLEQAGSHWRRLLRKQAISGLEEGSDD
jgi:hypothetical protein